jgi:pimeloyl-ACP methyl ester carboxylesterase
MAKVRFEPETVQHQNRVAFLFNGIHHKPQAHAGFSQQLANSAGLPVVSARSGHTALEDGKIVPEEDLENWNADDMHRQITRELADAPESEVILMGHSLGGFQIPRVLEWIHEIKTPDDNEINAKYTWLTNEQIASLRGKQLVDAVLAAPAPIDLNLPYFLGNIFNPNISAGVARLLPAVNSNYFAEGLSTDKRIKRLEAAFFDRSRPDSRQNAEALEPHIAGREAEKALKDIIFGRVEIDPEVLKTMVTEETLAFGIIHLLGEKDLYFLPRVLRRQAEAMGSDVESFDCAHNLLIECEREIIAVLVERWRQVK